MRAGHPSRAGTHSAKQRTPPLSRFVLAAVSPAVVVPCLLSLDEQGYGVQKGIPTLVIAAASIDDVLAISGFGVCLGMIFSQEGEREP